MALRFGSNLFYKAKILGLSGGCTHQGHGKRQDTAADEKGQISSILAATTIQFCAYLKDFLLVLSYEKTNLVSAEMCLCKVDQIQSSYVISCGCFVKSVRTGQREQGFSQCFPMFPESKVVHLIWRNGFFFLLLFSSSSHSTITFLSLCKVLASTAVCGMEFLIT